MKWTGAPPRTGAAMADPFLDATITNAQGDRAFVTRDALALLRECELAFDAIAHLSASSFRLHCRIHSFLSEVRARSHEAET